MVVHRMIVIVLSIIVLSGQTVFGQDASHDMDLGSTQRSVAAPVNSASTVTIRVGNAIKVVDGSTLLTPAEHLAVQQIINSGRQSLDINTAGAAIGGFFNLGDQNLGGLSIPANVSAYMNLARNAHLNVLGDLVNSGAIYAYSTNQAITSATVAANTITNNISGIITTLMPDNHQQLGDVLGTVDLNLNASRYIINAGIISSSGNLSLVAGTSVFNAVPAGEAGTAPLISAVNNLAITTNGYLLNQGVIWAGHDLNVASSGGSLLVENIRGAFTGNTIIVGDSQAFTKINTDIIGGMLHGNQVNVHSGKGIVNIAVDQLIGELNVYAGEAHIIAHESPNLLIGDMQLSGDPTIFNTTGSIYLNGSLSFAGEDLAILAAKNVIALPGSFIDTSGTTKGGDVTIVAGAQIFPVGSSARRPTGAEDPVDGIFSHYSQSDPGYWSLQNPAFGTLVTGAGNFAGSIDLSAMPDIETSSSGGVGGNVKLIAFGGSVVAPGINANGPVSGGSIQVIAPGGIELGNLSTNDGPVEILVSQPTAEVKLTQISEFGVHYYWLNGVHFRNGSILPESFSDGTTFSPGFSNYSLGELFQTNYNPFENAPLTVGNISTTNAVTVKTAGGLAVGNLIAGALYADGSSITIGAITTVQNDQISGVSLSSNGSLSSGVITLVEGSSLSIHAMSLTPLNVGSGEIPAIVLPSAGSGLTVSIGNLGGVSLSQDLASIGLERVHIDAGNGGFDLNGHTISTNGGHIGISVAGSAMDLGNNGVINADGLDGDGGTISIFTSVIHGSGTISANGGDNGNGGSVSVVGSNSETLLLDGSGNLKISADGAGLGSGGIVFLNGPALLIENTLHVDATANGGDFGSGGNVTVEASLQSNVVSVVIGIGEGEISLHADSGSVGGNGGQVIVNADGDVIVDSAAITASAQSVSGSGGLININAGNAGAGVLSLKGSVSVRGKGGGNGGQIYLFAPEISFDSAASIDLNADGGSHGNGGEIYLGTYSEDGDLSIGTGPGSVNLFARGGINSGNGGMVTVDAAGDLAVAGDGLAVAPQSLSGSGGFIELVSGFQSRDYICCPDGQVEVELTTGGEHTLSLSGEINANGTGQGNGGAIKIQAPIITSDGQAFKLTANGPGGLIVVKSTDTTTDMTLGAPDEESTISASVSNNSEGANAGKIIIESSAGVNIHADIDASTSSITAEPSEISIKTIAYDHDLTIDGKVSVDAKSNGSTAGRIDLDSGRALVISNGSLSANGTAPISNGGHIALKAITSIGVNAPAETISAKGGATEGNGGSISVETQETILLNVSGLAVDAAGNGNAGEVTVVSQTGDVTIESGISAVAFGEIGSGGDITVHTQGDYIRVSGDITFNSTGEGNGGNLSTDPAKATIINGSIDGVILKSCGLTD